MGGPDTGCRDGSIASCLGLLSSGWSGRGPWDGTNRGHVVPRRSRGTRKVGSRLLGWRLLLEERIGRGI